MLLYFFFLFSKLPLRKLGKKGKLFKILSLNALLISLLLSPPLSLYLYQSIPISHSVECNPQSPKCRLASQKEIRACFPVQGCNRHHAACHMQHATCAHNAGVKRASFSRIPPAESPRKLLRFGLNWHPADATWANIQTPEGLTDRQTYLDLQRCICIYVYILTADFVVVGRTDAHNMVH